MYLILKIPGKDANSVAEAIEVLKGMFGSMFSKVFKTALAITAENLHNYQNLRIQQKHQFISLIHMLLMKEVLTNVIMELFVDLFLKEPLLKIKPLIS